MRARRVVSGRDVHGLCGGAGGAWWLERAGASGPVTLMHLPTSGEARPVIELPRSIRAPSLGVSRGVPYVATDAGVVRIGGDAPELVLALDDAQEVLLGGDEALIARIGRSSSGGRRWEIVELEDRGSFESRARSIAESDELPRAVSTSAGVWVASWTRASRVALEDAPLGGTHASVALEEGEWTLELDAAGGPELRTGRVHALCAVRPYARGTEGAAFVVAGSARSLSEVRANGEIHVVLPRSRATTVAAWRDGVAWTEGSVVAASTSDDDGQPAVLFDTGAVAQSVHRCGEGLVVASSDGPLAPTSITHLSPA